MSKGFEESISQKRKNHFAKFLKRLDRWLKALAGYSTQNEVHSYFRSMWNEGSSLPDSTMITKEILCL